MCPLYCGVLISVHPYCYTTVTCCLSVSHYFHMHTVVDCGDLDDPTNGQVLLNGITFGSTATYTCDPGFILTGAMERICQANGNWSGNEPTCEGQLIQYTIYVYSCSSLEIYCHIIVNCGDLNDPNNGQVSLNGTILGSIATYTCDPGFNLTGDMERTCQANGDWSGSEPVCQSQFISKYLTFAYCSFKY